jgi:hypothetical protein
VIVRFPEELYRDDVEELLEDCLGDGGEVTGAGAGIGSWHLGGRGVGAWVSGAVCLLLVAGAVVLVVWLLRRGRRELAAVPAGPSTAELSRGRVADK